MDNDCTHHLPMESKRAIREPTGKAPSGPRPATRDPVPMFIDTTRLQTAHIVNDWHWVHDEHKQR